MSNFIRRFNARPDIQLIRQTTNFPIRATVEAGSELLQAGTSFALSDQFQSRWYRSIRAEDSRVLWFFESDEDAILFACKFGGDLKGPISISAWQRR